VSIQGEEFLMRQLKVFNTVKEVDNEEEDGKEEETPSKKHIGLTTSKKKRE
jgi:hypothetical protein